ncbi:hypothetical protein BGZ57DRAFT_1001267 [Hyaloscypha finlandica]|nr:hypothetical protein BGZ57DRAFT_1001267 [Hyaloscypha finlandica]
MSHSWPLVQMERFDACVEFHTLYEYCGCKFEELKHNELHHGIKKICHFVQPHYARIPEECDKYKTHPFSSGSQGTRIYKAIHIDAKAEQHVLLTPNKVEEKEDTRQDRLGTWIWEVAKHEFFKNAFREEQNALANFEAKQCNMRVEEDINDLHFDDRALVYDYRERYCELLSRNPARIWRSAAFVDVVVDPSRRDYLVTTPSTMHRT